MLTRLKKKSLPLPDIKARLSALYTTTVLTDYVDTNP